MATINDSQVMNALRGGAEIEIIGINDMAVRIRDNVPSGDFSFIGPVHIFLR